MNKTKFSIKFECIISFLLIGYFLIEIINNRFWLNDFKVYYFAVQNFNKGLPIYNIPFIFDSELYKYSPFALLIFTPLAYLPYFIAALIYYFILSILVFVILKETFQTINIVFPFIWETKAQIILSLTTLTVLTHIFNELYLGNVNLLLTFIYIYSLKLLIKEKQITAGFFIGLGMLFKPFFIILIPFLLIFKKYRCTGFTLLTLIAGLLLPALIVGFNSNNILLTNWFNTIKMNNAGLSFSPDTIYAWINKLFSIINIHAHGIIYILLIAIIVGVKYFIFILLNKKKVKHIDLTKLISFNRQHFTITYLMIVAFIPNLAVNESQSYLLSMPLIMLLIGYLLYNKKSIPLILKIITIIGLIFYGINYQDILSHNISAFLTNNGLLGLGNMIIIAVSACIFLFDNNVIKLRKES